MRKPLLILSAVFGLFFLFVGIADLKNYGANWDEPVHFRRGYAILHFFFTGEKDYGSDHSTTDQRSFFQDNDYSYEFFERKLSEGGSLIIGGGHPPASDVFSALSNFIFYSKLNVLGDVEAFHLYSIFLASLLVAYVFYFVTQSYGYFAGFISVLSLFLYPLFLGESRFNIKDVPETVFYSFTILFFYKGVVNRSGIFLFLSSLSFGFAVGTKFNVIFVPFILLVWLLIFYMNKLRKVRLRSFLKDEQKVLIWLIFIPLTGVLLFLLSWPLLWPDPVARVLGVFNYYRSIGITTEFDERFLTIFRFNTYAVQWILFITPLPILVLSALGLFYAVTKGWREKNKTAALILLWFIVPILRVSMPNVSIYGGVRQIIEYIPAMAMLSGIGAAYLLILLKRFKKVYLLKTIIVLTFIPIALKIISIHPNESIYFNEIIGGLKGAKEANLPGWGNSLGNTYRQGIRWINEHAEKNAKVVLGYELASSIPEFELRKDIVQNNQLRSGILREGEYAISLTHEGTSENLYYKKYLERFLNALYEVKVEEVAILKVWKNDLAHTKSEYAKNEEPYTDFVIRKGPKELMIHFNKVIRLTRIEINYDTKDCAVPTNGFFEVSKDGEYWEDIQGTFTFFYFAQWFNPQPHPGTLQYLFAGDEGRYLRIAIFDKNSCLLKTSPRVTIYHI